jgi:cation-transporting ATPase E
VLVAALLAVVVGALFTPAVSDYFGLTGAAPPVYTTVLPVLAIWFITLWAAYRYRVLDHLLGLRHLPATRKV